MILTEEHEKYQHYYLEALIDMNIRQVKVYCFWSRRNIEPVKFAYSPLEKDSFLKKKKKNRKKNGATESIDLSNKKRMN